MTYCPGFFLVFMLNPFVCFIVVHDAAGLNAHLQTQAKDTVHGHV